MADLKYSPEALKDLDGIWEHIRAELSNPDAADNTVNAILDRAETLREFPYSGAPLDAMSRIHSDYRFVTAGNYLAFYRVREETVYSTYSFISFVLLPRGDAILQTQWLQFSIAATALACFLLTQIACRWASPRRYFYITSAPRRISAHTADQTRCRCSRRSYPCCRPQGRAHL